MRDHCSASWCPPCRSFTPVLAEFYNNLHESKRFEIVFVSKDSNEQSFSSYFAKMPWLAIPYDSQDGQSAIDKLNSHFGVWSIPKLVVIDTKTGETITSDGRSFVMSDKTGAEFPWRGMSSWGSWCNML